MATRQETVDRIVGQATGTLLVSARKLFGEYTLYADDRLVALICDDRLFVKPTEAGRAYMGNVAEEPPYKGAKPCFPITEERIEATGWLAELVSLTADALPAPVRKPGKRKRGVSRCWDP